MANEACTTCLIDQLGWQPAASYPYSTAYRAPERIYCVGGVPVVPPSREVVALQRDFLYDYTELSQTVASTIPVASNGTFSNLIYTNQSVRTMSLLIFADSFISLRSTAAAGSGYLDVGFSFTTNAAQSGQAKMPFWTPYTPNSGYVSTSLSAAYKITLAVNETITIIPRVDWTPFNALAQYRMASAKVTVSVFGGNGST